MKYSLEQIVPMIVRLYVFYPVVASDKSVVKSTVCVLNNVIRHSTKTLTLSQHLNGFIDCSLQTVVCKAWPHVLVSVSVLL